MDKNASTEEYLTPEDFDIEESSKFTAKIEHFLESKYFLASLFLLASVISFCLGRISVGGDASEPVRVYNGNNSSANPPLDLGDGSSVLSEYYNNSASAANATSNSPSYESVVASKNGSKYHYPWCAGAKQIAEKNKITFSSTEEARANGYTPAANCKGLK